jgi:hypothetical protein
MFISLNEAVLNALRAELEERGVDVKDGHWGYRVMVVTDPDGNANEVTFGKARPKPAPVARGDDFFGFDQGAAPFARSDRAARRAARRGSPPPGPGGGGGSMFNWLFR